MSTTVGTGSGSGANSGWTPPSVERLQLLLPQYAIESMLGRGGMGAVYKGKQASLGRAVAIKVLPETLATGFDGEVDAHQYVERFKLEARSMANLDHPAIISVYDFGQTDAGHLYFVMEFIDGMDIEQYIQASGGNVDPEHAVAIVSHVLDALAYAHSKGIVHRDIKPANVLLNREGRVKIADFGLAKEFVGEGEDGSVLTGLTMTNVAMGTPDYIAPEALDEEAIPDHRADLYAVGVMLYRMLTGKLPRGIFKLPSEVNTQLDPRFDEVISLGMAGSPEERFQSASEFRSKLGEMLSQPISKVEAGQDSGAVRPVVTKGKLNFPTTASSAARSRVQAQETLPTSSSPKALMFGGVLAVCLLTGAFLFFVLRDREPATVDVATADHVGASSPEAEPQPDSTGKSPAEDDSISAPNPSTTATTPEPAEPLVATPLAKIPATSSGASDASPDGAKPAAPPASIDGEWRSIFDGQTMTGWRLVNKGTASVEIVDAAMVARGTKGYLFYDGAQLEDFELVMEVKTTANFNSGVFVQVSNEETFTAFPEVQIANGPRSDRGGLWTGGIWKGDRVKSTPAKDGEWFEFGISVVGKVITSVVNGTQLVRQDLGENPIDGVSTGKGAIAFQITDRTNEGGTVSFRNIRLRVPGDAENLTAVSGRPPSVAVEPTGDNTKSGPEMPDIADLKNRMANYGSTRNEEVGALIGFYRGALQREMQSAEPSVGEAVQLAMASLDDFEKRFVGSIGAGHIAPLPELKKIDDLPKKLAGFEAVFVEKLHSSEKEKLAALKTSLEDCEANAAADQKPEVRDYREAVLRNLGVDAGTSASPVSSEANPSAADKDGWRQIFNGENLDGWKVTGNPAGFEIEDGVLKAVGGVGLPAHLFWVDTGYQPEVVKNFQLSFSTRCEGPANSGIYFHASESGIESGRFPKVGLEFQLASSGSGIVGTGGIFKLKAPKVVFTEINEWFDVLIEVQGQRIVGKINGDVVVDYTDPDDRTDFGTQEYAQILPGGGGIAIQSNSRNGAWYFRDVRLRVMP